MYCKLVIIRHVPIFAIFVGAGNDEYKYTFTIDYLKPIL